MLPLLLVYILGQAWLANLLVWRLEMPWWVNFKAKYLNFKPFTCTTCYSFWQSYICNLVLMCLFTNVNLITFGWCFLLALTISFVATIMEKNTILF